MCESNEVGLIPVHESMCFLNGGFNDLKLSNFGHLPDAGLLLSFMSTQYC